MSKNEKLKVDCLKRRYEKNPDIATRKICEETVLVPVRRRRGAIQNIFVLNEMGSFIWELIEGKRQVNEIGDLMTKEFDVTSQQAEKDLVKLLKQLEEVDAIAEIC